MQWKSKILSWTICAALIGLTVSLPIEHAKLRRSIDHEEVQWNKTGKYLVITKEKNETEAGGVSSGKLVEFLELYSNSFQIAAGETSPLVHSHNHIGIGYEVDLNEAALKQVWHYVYVLHLHLSNSSFMVKIDKTYKQSI
ncbi:MAG: hypothetical protein MPL62_15365 [Alphaproteobacteria bacterium]|nr:hypothetical protein [Alphaproteobacteria bacterium]